MECQIYCINKCETECEVESQIESQTFMQRREAGSPAMLRLGLSLAKNNSRTNVSCCLRNKYLQDKFCQTNDIMTVVH